METDPRPEVQGPAALFLGKHLETRANNLPEMESKEAAVLRAQSEQLFERAANSYTGVPLERYGTVGRQAKKELFALRHLSRGNPAPDIEAEDQDGQRFKLSDYRGKVVPLHFWSQT
jgi:hypothetical protein